MEDQIKVGDVVISNISNAEYRINYVFNSIVVFDDREYETFFNLEKYYTIKKPEPVLKKLGARVHINGDFACLTFDNRVGHQDWIKKELIVKDGSLYVDMSEVEK